MDTVIEAVPAYGRDYTSQKAVLEDWKAGKDFQAATLGTRGCYFSSRDAAQMKRDGTKWVNIRYAKLTKVAVIKL